jgi:hypothetical protein
MIIETRMTTDREYILAELHYTYETDCLGIITSPGRYQGQPLYVPYFWQYIIANDMFDRTDTTYGYLAYVVKIAREEIALFPQLAHFTSIRFWLGDSGFVYHGCQT